MIIKGISFLCMISVILLRCARCSINSFKSFYAILTHHIPSLLMIYAIIRIMKKSFLCYITQLNTIITFDKITMIYSEKENT